MTPPHPEVTDHGTEHIRGHVWCNGKAVDGFDLDDLSERIGEPDTVIWADLECPSHETMQHLAEELDLDPFAVEDTVAAAERVKMVSYPAHTFIMVYAITLNPKGKTSDSDDLPEPKGTGYISPRHAHCFDLHRISIFIKKNALITVRRNPGFDIEEVVKRWSDVGGQQHGVGALLHGLLDVVVDGHFDAVQYLDDQIEDLEAILFDEKTPAHDLQRRSFDLRKDIVVLRRVVLPMREVISGIQRRRFENHAPPELDPHFSDLYDHALRAAEWTDSLRDMITTVFETNLSLTDARLNTVMKKLTGWAAIIAVPTAITGFYGQNVPFPGFSATGGFITSSVLIIGMVTVLYFWFRRKDYL